VKKLHHETGESLEGSRYADGGRDFNEHAFSGMDVDLELSGLVDGRVEQCQ